MDAILCLDDTLTVWHSQYKNEKDNEKSLIQINIKVWFVLKNKMRKIQDPRRTNSEFQK